MSELLKQDWIILLMTTPLSDPVLEAAAQICAAGKDEFSLDMARGFYDAYPERARVMIKEAARQLEALKGKDDE